MIGGADDHGNGVRCFLSLGEFRARNLRRSDQIVAVVDADLAVLDLGGVIIGVIDFDGVLRSIWRLARVSLKDHVATDVLK